MKKNKKEFFGETPCIIQCLIFDSLFFSPLDLRGRSSDHREILHSDRKYAEC